MEQLEILRFQNLDSQEKPKQWKNVGSEMLLVALLIDLLRSNNYNLNFITLNI